MAAVIGTADPESGQKGGDKKKQGDSKKKPGKLKGKPRLSITTTSKNTDHPKTSPPSTGPGRVQPTEQVLTIHDDRHGNLLPNLDVPPILVLSSSFQKEQKLHQEAQRLLEIEKAGRDEDKKHIADLVARLSAAETALTQEKAAHQKDKEALATALIPCAGKKLGLEEIKKRLELLLDDITNKVVKNSKGEEITLTNKRGLNVPLLCMLYLSHLEEKKKDPTLGKVVEVVLELSDKEVQDQDLNESKENGKLLQKLTKKLGKS